jgi:hypothetical protein
MTARAQQSAGEDETLGHDPYNGVRLIVHGNGAPEDCRTAREHHTPVPFNDVATLPFALKRVSRNSGTADGCPRRFIQHRDKCVFSRVGN